MPPVRAVGSVGGPRMSGSYNAGRPDRSRGDLGLTVVAEWEPPTPHQASAPQARWAAAPRLACALAAAGLKVSNREAAWVTTVPVDLQGECGSGDGRPDNRPRLSGLRVAYDRVHTLEPRLVAEYVSVVDGTMRRWRATCWVASWRAAAPTR
jgi:hypothetical protein